MRKRKNLIIIALMFIFVMIPGIVYAGTEVKLETPSIHCQTDTVGPNKIHFSAHCDEVDFDYMVAEVSPNKNYSSPIVKKQKFSYAPSNNLHFDFTGLQPDRLYYIRVKVTANVNGKTISSGYGYATMHTTRKIPVYSSQQKDVKAIVAKMKKNKTFKYRFNGCYNIHELNTDFMREINEDYPQYVERYDQKEKVTDTYTEYTFVPNKAGMKRGKKMEKVINSIAKKARKCKGRRKQVTCINDQLCKICSYGSTRNSKAYTAYGCLIKHKAVCMGYSHAFRAVAAQLKIPTIYEGSDRLDHVWNKVKIGKKWYCVDVTWNDGTHSHRYLLIKKHKR